jgi:photosystem II stability/assembly factor-like uncharacterized protein
MKKFIHKILCSRALEYFTIVSVSVAIFFLLLCAPIISAQTPSHSWKPLTNSRAYTIKINPLNRNTLYIGNADDKVLRSYDAGLTWDTLLAGSGGSGSHLSTFHICRNDTNVLLAGGWVYQGLRRSTDGGATWQMVLSDPTFTRIWFLSEALVEDPNSPNILYVSRGQVSNDIYRSMDCGATWELMSVIPQSVTTRLHTIAIRPDSTNILFVGGQTGVIARSDDSGRTWRPVPVDGKLVPLPSDAELPKIIFSKRNPQIGYAVITISNPDSIAGNGGLFQTRNGGASWNRIAFNDTSLWAVEIQPVGNREDVWIGGFRTWTLPSVIKGDSVVRRSSDGGTTWLNYDDVPWMENEQGNVIANVWIIRYDTLSGRLYLSTESGLYVLEEPVSVSEGDITGESHIDVKVDGSNIVVTSSTSPLQVIEVYSIVGDLVHRSFALNSKSHSFSLDPYSRTPMYIVVRHASGIYRTMIMPR